MNNGAFFDIDGTLTGTKSGATFKQTPKDVLVLPGVQQGLKYYKLQDYTLIGVSNQGGCSAINHSTGQPFKSIEATIEEMQYTLELLPCLTCIFFCPDMEGYELYKVDAGGGKLIANALEITSKPSVAHLYRKPNYGMISQGCSEYNLNRFSVFMVGDRPEDKECAANAVIPFYEAEAWRQQFWNQKSLPVIPSK